MNTRSLRSRLVLWYALWLGVVFLTTGALLYLAVGHYLEGTVATAQRSRAERVARLVARLGEVSSNRFAAEITADFAPEASDRFIRVSRENGAVLYESAPPGDQSFDPRAIRNPPSAPGCRRELLPGGPDFELATVSTPAGGPRYRVEVGESLAPALKELQRLLVSLGFGLVIVMIVALAGGYVLVNRALRSVAEITRSAAGITSRNLGERLPVPATGDEFEQLSLALNHMIARLDEAFQYNRRFLADASHELRTPLTILQSELESLERHAGIDDAFQDTLGNLLEEVHRLTRMVESLFALSRLDAGVAAVATSRFDLARLAATTAEQMCLLAEDKGIKITCQTTQPVMVDGDKGRFKQVIVNLLDNAIKYTPASGAVTLSVRAEDGHAVCEVRDNGIGIPATALPQVFERFFRVDPARSRDLGGAGIGLSIVKAICLAHNGRVTVESTEGRGSCFRVYLPLPPGES